MSSIFSYLKSFVIAKDEDLVDPIKVNGVYHVNEEVENEYSLVDNKFLISHSDLEKICLKPVSDVIPGPSRNMPPLSRVNLQSLNRAQLQTILDVKLKPTQVNEKPKYYECRHPVLRQLIEKFKDKPE